MASYRYILVPETVTLKLRSQQGETKQQQLAFADFVRDTVLNDNRFGTNRATLRAAERIEGMLKDAAPGDELKLEYPDWHVLSQATESPKSPYFAAIARQLLPYLDAVLEAEKEPRGARAPAKAADADAPAPAEDAPLIPDEDDVL